MSAIQHCPKCNKPRTQMFGCQVDGCWNDEYGFNSKGQVFSRETYMSRFVHRLGIEGNYYPTQFVCPDCGGCGCRICGRSGRVTIMMWNGRRCWLWDFDQDLSDHMEDVDDL